MAKKSRYAAKMAKTFNEILLETENVYVKKPKSQRKHNEATVFENNVSLNDEKPYNLRNRMEIAVENTIAEPEHSSYSLRSRKVEIPVQNITEKPTQSNYSLRLIRVEIPIQNFIEKSKSKYNLRRKQ